MKKKPSQNKPFHQGTYTPSNPEKVIWQKDKRTGKTIPIQFLSGLEFNYFHLIDKSPNIVKWGSEIIHVPYINPAKLDRNNQPKLCHYMVDLYIETKDGQYLLVEIKPEKEIKAITEGKAPKATKRKSVKTLKYQTKYYHMNKAKWEAAHYFANERGWKFIQVSEKNYNEKTIPFL